MEYTAQQIAQVLGGTVDGNPSATVKTFARIEEGVPGAISFLSDARYEHFLYETRSSVVLVNRDFRLAKPISATLVRVDDARECLARLLNMVQQSMARRSGIHPQACIASTARVGEGCYVGPFAYIGEHVELGAGTQVYAHCVVEENTKIGAACTLYPGVSVYHDCVVGDRVVLHSGCVVGADGFGFAPAADGYEKIPQIGNVVIEDDVEIGANACVDRAMMGSTFVRKGVKLDNLVQIAHNCDIGCHTVMSAQVGVAGSAKIGQWCMFGGQVGIAGHISVADRTQSGAQAGIAGNVRKPGQTIIGSPAIDARRFARASAVFKNLPEVYADVNEMKRKLED